MGRLSPRSKSPPCNVIECKKVRTKKKKKMVGRRGKYFANGNIINYSLKRATTLRRKLKSHAGSERERKILKKNYCSSVE